MCVHKKITTLFASGTLTKGKTKRDAWTSGLVDIRNYFFLFAFAMRNFYAFFENFKYIVELNENCGSDT